LDAFDNSSDFLLYLDVDRHFADALVVFRANTRVPTHTPFPVRYRTGITGPLPLAGNAARKTPRLSRWSKGRPYPQLLFQSRGHGGTVRLFLQGLDFDGLAHPPLACVVTLLIYLGDFNREST
jgi:hypothetical protein